jgi:hypothetical protein
MKDYLVTLKILIGDKENIQRVYVRDEKNSLLAERRAILEELGVDEADMDEFGYVYSYNGEMAYKAISSEMVDDKHKKILRQYL